MLNDAEVEGSGAMPGVGWGQEWLQAAPVWLEGLGWWGPGVLAAAYVPLAALCLPAWPLTFLAGFMYGVGPGFLTAWLGKTAGAIAAFAVSRWLLRGRRGTRWLEQPRFAALLLGIDREPAWIIGLARLSPLLPYNLLNYLFGLTHVPVGTYTWSSAIGMAPTALLYVYLGATTHNVVDALAGRAEPQLAKWLVFGLGLVATIAVVIMLRRAAQRALAEVRASSEPRT